MPVLLLHAEEDTTVPFGQSSSLYAALENAPARQLVTFEGDDHQIARSTSRIRIVEETLAFLAAHHPAR